MKRQFDLSKNFIVVQGWMLTDTNLSGNKLLAYAFIYGLTQWSYYEEQCRDVCSFSYEYLSQLLKITKRATMKLLNQLEQEGWIIKYQTFLEGEKKTRNHYKIQCYNYEQCSLFRGEQSTPPKEYIIDSKKINKRNINKELENKPIKQLTKQELEILREEYKTKLQMLTDRIKTINWIDD